VKLLLAALLLLPVTALADTQRAGAPAPPKNAPVDKKGNAVPDEPVKRPPPDRAPAEKAPPDKDRSGSGAGSGSDAAPTHKPVKSPPRHA